MGYNSKIYRSRGFRVSVSTGNIKMGNVLSISFPPAITCIYNAPCAKECYANKSFNMYETVRNAWTRNHETAAHAPAFFFNSIADAIRSTPSHLFRVHVSGDFFAKWYMRAWYDFANEECARGTQFLAFTKRYSWAESLDHARPRNFTTVLSAWPKLDMSETDLPVAYMQDGNETRVPIGAKECAGDCENCAFCFTMKENDSVFFHKH